MLPPGKNSIHDPKDLRGEEREATNVNVSHWPSTLRWKKKPPTLRSIITVRYIREALIVLSRVIYSPG